MFSNLFKKSSLGLDIKDDSIKFIELLNTKNGLQVGRYGERSIPSGVIESGKIKDPDKIEKILSKLRKEEGIKSTRVSLPDISKDIIKSYLSVFKHSKINVKSFELEAQAVSRAVVKKNDRGTYLIVNLGRNQNVIFIISGGVLAHHSIASNAIYFLRDEIARHFLSWHIREDKKEENNPPIQKVILYGDELNLTELSEYFSVSLRNKVEVANVWINILDTKKCIPEISLKQSFAFAAALGLALGGFKGKK